MNKVVRIDPDGLTATVQAGVVWEKLDRELAKQGLTLRLYPSSYPSSTVGGWLAQGGAGIGSYESGWFCDNVVSARVVLPDGSVREFSGPDLDLIAEAEGITGLISQVTLRVQPLEELEVVGGLLPRRRRRRSSSCSPSSTTSCPIWSVLFINPRMAELKNKAPLQEHYGHPARRRCPCRSPTSSSWPSARRTRPRWSARLPEILAGLSRPRC